MGRMPDATPRPAQVTIAAWLVMAGSVFVVLTAFDQIAGLHSLETRESVEELPEQASGREPGAGRRGDAQRDAGDDHGHGRLRDGGGDPGLPGPAPVPVGTAGAHPARRAAVPRRDGGRRLPARRHRRLDHHALVPAGPGLDRRQGAAGRPGGHRRRRRPWSRHRPRLPPGAERAAGLPGLRRAAGRSRSTGPWPAPCVRRAAGAPGSPACALVWACALAWAGSAVAFVVMLVSVAVVLAAPDLLIDELTTARTPSCAPTASSPARCARRCSSPGPSWWSGPSSLRSSRPSPGVAGPGPGRRSWSRVQRLGALPARRRSAARRCSSRWRCAGSPSRCCCGRRCAPSSPASGPSRPSRCRPTG